MRAGKEAGSTRGGGIIRPAAIAAGLILAGPARAQDHPYIETPDSLREKAGLRSAMERGEIDGLFRLFSMSTWNRSPLTDAHALAFGGRMGYTTQRVAGFDFRLAGGFTFDLSSFGVEGRDPVTNMPNRYEIGLFDVTDPERRSDIAYVQEFHLRYLTGDGRLGARFGRQMLDTPFLNGQDGRMHPTIFDGAWGEWAPDSAWTVRGGWIFGTVPRGTERGYSTAKSIGLYAPGVNERGVALPAAGYLRSRGIAVMNVERKVGKHIRVDLWNVYADNLMNTAMLRLDLGRTKERPNGWVLGAMFTRQDRTGNGGHPDPGIAYAAPGWGSSILSARVGRVRGRFRLTANYTRITAEGRFLMPREWGRDPWYTFLPRERLEGFGDTHAATVALIAKELKPGLRIEIDHGITWLPGLEDVRMRKYIMPSYTQTVLNVQKTFGGAFSGLAAQLMVQYKTPVGDPPVDQRYVIHRVNMHHVSAVLNYAF